MPAPGGGGGGGHQWWGDRQEEEGGKRRECQDMEGQVELKPEHWAWGQGLRSAKPGDSVPLQLEMKGKYKADPSYSVARSSVASRCHDVLGE